MESNTVKFPDDPSVTLTIRLIMQGKVSHLHTITIDFLKSRIAIEIHPSITRIYLIQVINLSSLWSFASIFYFTTFFWRTFIYADRNQQHSVDLSAQGRAKNLLNFSCIRFSIKCKDRLLMNSNNGANISVVLSFDFIVVLIAMLSSRCQM